MEIFTTLRKDTLLVYCQSCIELVVVFSSCFLALLVYCWWFSYPGTGDTYVLVPIIFLAFNFPTVIKSHMCYNSGINNSFKPKVDVHIGKRLARFFLFLVALWLTCVLYQKVESVGYVGLDIFCPSGFYQKNFENDCCLNEVVDWQF